jgi:hypothetical protein
VKGLSSSELRSQDVHDGFRLHSSRRSPGYTDEVLQSAGIPGTARTPGTDGLFEVRYTALPVPEKVSVWFRCTVAMILYLAKRARPELLSAVSYLATPVIRCESDDMDKMIRLYDT